MKMNETKEKRGGFVIPDGVGGITVFYDGRCGMCCTFHEWVNRQERLFSIRFIPYQSREAEAVLPGIGRMDAGLEMIVRTDDGTLFRGAEAWVLCLFALSEYRAWARRLSHPRLLPMAKKVCVHLANNRRALSKVFFRKKDVEVAAALHRMPPRPAACLGDFCGV